MAVRQSLQQKKGAENDLAIRIPMEFEAINFQTSNLPPFCVSHSTLGVCKLWFFYWLLSFQGTCHFEEVTDRNPKVEAHRAPVQASGNVTIVISR